MVERGVSICGGVVYGMAGVFGDISSMMRGCYFLGEGSLAFFLKFGV